MFVDMYRPYRLLKTTCGREAQFHAEQLSNFEMNSHIDPIGDQNDVQYLLAFDNVFQIFGMSGTAPK